MTTDDPVRGLIVAKPEVLGGRPCVRGTRISVAHILEMLASGATRDDVLAAHPQIISDGFAAALQWHE